MWQGLPEHPQVVFAMLRKYHAFPSEVCSNVAAHRGAVVQTRKQGLTRLGGVHVTISPLPLRVRRGSLKPLSIVTTAFHPLDFDTASVALYRTELRAPENESA